MSRERTAFFRGLAKKYSFFYRI